MTKDLYLDQKLGENRKREYTTIIDIVDVKDLLIGKNGARSVKDSDGKYYTFFYGNPEHEKFAEELKIGNTVGVYVRQTPNPKNDKFPYRNIYPKLF